MAYLQDLKCSRCGKEWHGVASRGTSNQLCYECRKIEEDTEKKKWMLDRRNKKTIEQRIEWIEEWIYKHEGVRHGYIEPPRF